MSSPARASSPYHVRRVEEKIELRGLNQRLESYVLHSQTLIDERDRLQAELETVAEIHKSEMDALKSEHASTLSLVRFDLKETRTELAKSESQVVSLTKTVESLKAKWGDYASIKKERDRLRSQVRPLEEENEDLRRQLAALQKEHEEMAVAFSVMKRELAGMTTQYEALRQDSGDNDRQIDALTIRHKAEMKKIKDSVALNIRNAREEWERNSALRMAKFERDIKEHYEKELDELRARCLALSEQVDRLTLENGNLSAEVSAQTKFANEMMMKVQAAEESARGADHAASGKYSHLERTITTLRTSLASKEDEFNELMDIKISLEAEIAHYRAILEEEEKRFGLNFSVGEGSADGAGAGAGGLSFDEMDDDAAVTPAKSKGKGKAKGSAKKSARKSTPRSSKKTTTKIKATETVEIEASGSASGRKKRRTVTRTITRSDVRFPESGFGMEVDLVADTVTITNNTGSDVSFDGWVLKSEVGTQNFKFPEGYVLAADDSVTVWSGKNAKKHEDPPSNLFWTRRYIWNNDGDSALLLDSEGETIQAVVGTPLDAEEAKAVVAERGGECSLM